MKYFQVIAAKNNERVELVVKYETELEARENLHAQGYSIIEIRETDINAQNKSGSTFYFDVRIAGQKKSGQIVSDDIFRAYKKLVDDLGYEVLAMYATKDASDEEKAFTTGKVRESYAAYSQVKKDSAPTQSQPSEQKKDPDGNQALDTNTVLGREIIRYQGLIMRVFEKIEMLLATYGSEITEERKVKFQTLLSSLKQIRQITNVDKLRLIGEASLLKVGELEIELAGKQANIKRSDFLKETNKLLKDFGSNKKIGSETDEFKSKLKLIFTSLLEDFNNRAEKAEEAKKIRVDNTSYVYYKNLRELGIYKEKLKEVKREIMKSIFAKKDKKDRLALKKRLILQNIALIQNRIESRSFSYTRLVK